MQKAADSSTRSQVLLCLHNREVTYYGLTLTNSVCFAFDAANAVQELIDLQCTVRCRSLMHVVNNIVCPEPKLMSFHVIHVARYKFASSASAR